MIPKTIHYCWFGGSDKPDDVKTCIKSWEKYLPDYEIIEWNEHNFDINQSNQYVKEAYGNRKWAFVSDYVRLSVLYKYGGLYFDTDVEVFKSFDPLLENKCFLGFESNDYVASAIIGCEPKHELIGRFLNLYQNRSFLMQNGSFDLTTNVVILTELLYQYGLKPNGKLQTINDDIVVFPQYYFASNDLINIFGKYNKRIWAYHHYLASWYENSINRTGKKDQIRHYIVGILRNIVGTDVLNNIRDRNKK